MIDFGAQMVLVLVLGHAPTSPRRARGAQLDSLRKRPNGGGGEQWEAETALGLGPRLRGAGTSGVCWRLRQGATDGGVDDEG
jgi:hypothetical protein